MTSSEVATEEKEKHSRTGTDPPASPRESDTGGEFANILLLLLLRYLPGVHVHGRTIDLGFGVLRRILMQPAQASGHTVRGKR